MKRTYMITRERVVYHTREVVFDTQDWEQMDDLLSSITDIEYQSWDQVPQDVRAEVLEYFESTLEDEDVTADDNYDTEEWSDGNRIELFEEEAAE